MNSEHWIDLIFDDPLILTIGAIAIYFGVKSFLDTHNNPEKDLGSWGRDNWIQIPIALLVGVILISKDDEIAEYYFGANENGGKVFPWYIYLTVPLLLNIIYELVKILPEISKTIVKKIKA